jgi:nucleoside-diphosphate-sugar epimerase
LENELGFKPRTNLKDGLRETIQWMAHTSLKAARPEENVG